MSITLKPSDSLWQFSTRFYGDAAVEERCLRLQNEWQFNVNYLLLALWHGLAGRGELTPAQFGSWRNSTQDLEQSLAWLRMVRQSVKAQLGTQSSGLLQDYYLCLRETELKGEQALQAQLAGWAQPAMRMNESQTVAAARTNLVNYRTELDIAPEPALLSELDHLLEQAAQFVRQVPIL